MVPISWVIFLPPSAPQSTLTVKLKRIRQHVRKPRAHNPQALAHRHTVNGRRRNRLPERRVRQRQLADGELLQRVPVQLQHVAALHAQRQHLLRWTDGERVHRLQAALVEVHLLEVAAQRVRRQLRHADAPEVHTDARRRCGVRGLLVDEAAAVVVLAPEWAARSAELQRARLQVQLLDVGEMDGAEGAR